MYIYIYVHIYIYIYTCNHKNNLPFLLSRQWLCGNSCTWTHVHKLPQSYCGDNQEGIVSLNTYIYYAHLRDFSTLCVLDHLWPLYINSLFRK